MNKTSLWIVVVVAAAWIGFMLGYSMATHTGTKPAPMAAPASGGYGGVPAGQKPAASGGYGGVPASQKPAPGGNVR